MGEVGQLVSGRCFFMTWLLRPPGVQSSKWIFVGRERKRLECKMGLGERLLYLCLNERHTQGDRDKAHGSESSPKPT
jgi:hypothetical protein